MDKDLVIRIEERREEAFTKEIGEKANFIVYNLGWHKKEEVPDYGTVIEGGFKNNSFEIKGACSFITILYNNKIIYERQGYDKKDIISYVPGEWEKELEELYFKAEVARGNKIRADKEDEEREKLKEEGNLKARFGLK